MHNYLQKTGYTLLYTSILVTLFFISDYLFHLYNKHYTFGLEHQPIPNLFSYILVLSLIPSKKIRFAFLSITLGASLVEYLHVQYFGTHIQPISFYQFYYNLDEVSESFLAEISQMFIPLIIIVLMGFCFFWFEKKWNSSKQFQFKQIAFLIVGIFFYQSVKTYRLLNDPSGKLNHHSVNRLYPRNTLHSADNFQRSLKFFMYGIIPKKIFGNIAFFPELEEPKKGVPKECNIILIIGETLRAKQLQLLGYDKNTTPHLSARQDLFSSKIYSAGTMTKTSIPAILNRVKYVGATSQIMSRKNSLFRLAKENGFKTYFMSAQKKSHLNILESYIGKEYIEGFTNRSTFKNETKTPYDDILLNYLNKIDFSENNFVVLQQRGSHTPYKKQYPKTYKKFESDYNNTVLFTDFILNHIINDIQKKSTKPTYIFFTSDHGELLSEKGKNGHGWFEEEVYRVPFIFTSFNDSTDYISDLKNVESHFDLSNLITHFLGYQTNDPKEQLKNIYVNGSDIDALAGYLHIRTKNGIQVSVKEIR